MNAAVSRLSATEMADIVRRGRRVVPSSPNQWEGSPEPGSPWTKQQLAVLAAEGIGLAWVRRFSVAMERPSPHGWTMPPERFSLDVPQLARSRDGRHVLIVTPSGDKVWRKAK